MLDDDIGERAVSRRKFLTAGITAGAATAGIVMLPDGADAQVTMDTLNVSGDDATLADPPAEVRVSVSGSWELQAPEPPEQVRQTLQLHYNGTAEDVAENIVFDGVESGDYQLEANAFDHPELDAQTVIPEESGQVKTTELTVRVILGAVSGGELQAETFVEDTAPIEIERDGMKLSVGGSGSVEIVP